VPISFGPRLNRIKPRRTRVSIFCYHPCPYLMVVLHPLLNAKLFLPMNQSAGNKR
jgi:hypothetical protein